MGYTDQQGGDGMKFLTVLLLIILASSLLIAQGGRMKQDTKTFFTTQYDDPVIEKLHGSHEKVFPSLTVYSVFEKSNLAEDPLIPDIWIRTASGNFFPSGNIEEALKEDRVFPGNRTEALAFAREIVRIRHDCYYFITGTASFDGTIPDVYNREEFYPSVEQTANGFIVRLHVYYPDRRYAEFFSPYRKDLVEYTVSCDGINYSVKTGRVYRDGMDNILH